MIDFFAYNFIPTGLFAPQVHDIPLRESVYLAYEKRLKCEIEPTAFYMLIKPEDVDGIWTKALLVKAVHKRDDVLDDDEGVLKSIDIENKATTVTVLFNSYYNVVLIQRSRTSQEKCTDVLKDLLKQAYALMNVPIDIEFKPHLNSDEFLIRVFSLDRVVRMKSTLYRPNPKYNEIWKPIHDDLIDSESDTIDIGASSVGGVNLESDTIVSKSMYMVQDGYGDGEVGGFDPRGKFVTIQSKTIGIDKHTFSTASVADLKVELRPLNEILASRFKRSEDYDS